MSSFDPTRPPRTRAQDAQGGEDDRFAGRNPGSGNRYAGQRSRGHGGADTGGADTGGGNGPASPPLWGLPDPQTEAGFYEGVPTRRLIAFGIDSVIIGLGVVLVLPFTAFTGLFFLPLLAIFVSFLYRLATVASASATWGMRLTGIELRDHRGERLAPGTAFAHVLLYLFFLGMVVPMLISIGAMLMSPRKQALHDLFLGTAAIRSPSRI